MNTAQIEACIRQDPYMKAVCLGCFASDQLPAGGLQLPFGLVVNTDPSNKPGEHWVSCWVGSDGRGEYFDSYGGQARPVLRRFLDKNAPNGLAPVLSHPVQGLLSTVCGQHCIYFLYKKSRGSDYSEISDNDVNSFVESKFALDLQPYDVKLIVNQLCKAFMK